MKKHMRAVAFFATVFLTTAGTMLYTQAASGEWKQDDVGIWYQYTDGSFEKSGWVQLDDQWYYFDENGYVKTGWFQLGVNWYLADAAGVMQTGIREDGGYTYLLADSGEMLIGWQRVDNEWRFFRMNNSEGYPTGSMMTENVYEQEVVKYGIDISKWQGDINWDQVKEYGIDFTIIRIGHGERTLDTEFQQNMTRVNELGIPAGVYFYSEAKDPAQAVLDAQWVIDNLNGYTISYPVVIDMEDQSQSIVLSKAQITGIAGAFCDEIAKAGYTPMIYCNENWAKNYLDLNACSNAKRWIARYNYKYDPENHPDIWQCSSKGRIGGIQGNVDIDFAFTDFTQSIVPRTAASETYVKSSGVWRYDSGGTWYQYLTGGYPANQWALIDGRWYWFDARGYLGTASGWYELDGKWYYYDTNGAPVTGWVAVGSKWYYLDAASSGALKTGWAEIDGKWYYFDTTGDGRMLYGWQKINNQWYYLSDSASDGSMQTGWLKSNGKWYYLGESGDGAMKTGWQLIGGQWYYFDTTGDGKMLYGWQKINNQWYYLSSSASDGAMKTGWLKNNGKWYYLGESGDGAMKTGRQTIDGIEYVFAANGAMQ